MSELKPEALAVEIDTTTGEVVSGSLENTPIKNSGDFFELDLNKIGMEGGFEMSDKQDPVGEICRLTIHVSDNCTETFNTVKMNRAPDSIPVGTKLYTHPMSELSVDEIRTCSMEAWDACSGDEDNDYDIVFARSLIAAAKGGE